MQLNGDGEGDVRRNLMTVAAPRPEKPLAERPAVRLGPDNPSLETRFGLRDADGHPSLGVGTKGIVTELAGHHAAQLVLRDAAALLVSLVFEPHQGIRRAFRQARCRGESQRCDQRGAQIPAQGFQTPSVPESDENGSALPATGMAAPITGRRGP